MTRLVTKCEYYRNGSGWLYRCWYDGRHDEAPAIWHLETAPRYNAPPVNAFCAVVRDITRDRPGLALACNPEYLERNPEPESDWYFSHGKGFID